MRLSADRILTTHVGSLPRPPDVAELLLAKGRDEPVDADRFDRVVARAVGDVVRRQADVGVDLVSDGEMSKLSYATYISERLTGFEGNSPRRSAHRARRRPALARPAGRWGKDGRLVVPAGV